MSERFNAFGTPLVPVELFSLKERVQMLRADLASWKYGTCSPFIGAWLAAAVDEFLQHGGDLAGLLLLKPKRGSRATAQRIERMGERDALLVRLSVAVGTAARAQRVLAGIEACPARARPLVEALKRHELPRSRAAFTRARKVSRPQR